MTLRSIPPANRRPIRVSSMRAATKAGLIFVGGHIGGQQQSVPVTENTFHPKVISANPDIWNQRGAYYKSRQILIDQLKELIAIAIEPEEIVFWQQQLDKLKGAL